MTDEAVRSQHHWQHDSADRYGNKCGVSLVIRHARSCHTSFAHRHKDSHLIRWLAHCESSSTPIRDCPFLTLLCLAVPWEVPVFNRSVEVIRTQVRPNGSVIRLIGRLTGVIG